MILFGRSHHDLPPLVELFSEAARKRAALQGTKLAQIIDVLHDFGQLWRPGSALFNAALKGLKADLPFSQEMVELTLGVIPELLSREALTKRVRGEFDDPQALDEFVTAKNGIGKVRAFPVGEVLHVTAGNVFISCIDSLVMGFLTKNVSYLKLSSRNNFFPFFFAQALVEFDKRSVVADKFCMLIWKGGTAEIEHAFKQHVPAIIAWGGEEMLSSYRSDLALGTKLLDYGPKISFQVVTKRGIEKLGVETLGTAIAQDLIMWDQQACSSPQNLFVEKGADIPKLQRAIADALEQSPLGRGQLSADEQVEILKERERARVSRLLEQGHSLEGKEWLLHYETRPYLRTSPLNRSLVMKPFADLGDLVKQVAPFRFYLQSCGYATGVDEKAAFLASLGSTGIKRFTPIGQMSSSFPGLPHDGRYGLTELVNFVTDEAASVVDDFITHLKTQVPLYQGCTHQRLEDFPFTSGATYAAHDPATDPLLLAQNSVGGRYFASGGTTGKPKHVFYSNADFDRMCADLADNFLRAGLRAGTKVANLFAAGALYSSFLAVDKYCEKIGLRQLPIGGLLNPDDIVKLLAHHRPEAIFGLPSLIVQYAKASERLGMKLEVPMVFYAGENLSEGARAYLTKCWGTTKFWSAGYATVDAGVIGYQCAHTPYGVHHVLTPYVHFEIHDGEAVVTSFRRDGMPVVRYRTGDHVEWVEGECACGDRAKRFRLIGRMDSQINIWSCRVSIKDIEAAVVNALGDGAEYQVLVESVGADERMTLLLKRPAPQVIPHLYELCSDLRKTVSLAFVQEWLQVKVVSEFEQNSRTGKIPKLIDRR